MTSAITFYPQTKEDLVKCMNRNECSVFRPKTLTHVLFLFPLHDRTISLMIGPLFLRKHSTLQFHALRSASWNPTWWLRDGRACRCLTVALSTMVTTRTNGSNIFVISVTSSMYSLRVMLWICRIRCNSRLYPWVLDLVLQRPSTRVLWKEMWRFFTSTDVSCMRSVMKARTKAGSFCVYQMVVYVTRFWLLDTKVYNNWCLCWTNTHNPYSPDNSTVGTFCFRFSLASQTPSVHW